MKNRKRNGKDAPWVNGAIALIVLGIVAMGVSKYGNFLQLPIGLVNRGGDMALIAFGSLFLLIGIIDILDALKQPDPAKWFNEIKTLFTRGYTYSAICFLLMVAMMRSDTVTHSSLIWIPRILSILMLVSLIFGVYQNRKGRVQNTLLSTFLLILLGFVMVGFGIYGMI